ncbi:MAG: crossover junction endodeoxyribonuclease RuvC [Alphaproteobacteria bacterium]
MIILGLDPGLRRTGWGVISLTGNRLDHMASGVIDTSGGDSLALRLVALFDGVGAVIADHRPDTAAVEETFVNRNPASALKLGQARGVVLMAPAAAGLPVHEYAANLVKKTVVGVGHAAKDQVALMVRRILPTARPASHDAADALAVAICHAHLAATAQRVGAGSTAAATTATWDNYHAAAGNGRGR